MQAIADTNLNLDFNYFFQKWYRDTRKKVVEVQVDGAPVIGHEEQSGAISEKIGRAHV